MKNSMYASPDGRKLGVFEGDSNHALVFSYIPSLDVVEVRIMTGEMVEARFTISVHDNQNWRKYEGLLGLQHYCERIIEEISKADSCKVS